MYPKTILASAIAVLVLPVFAQDAAPVTSLSTVTVTADRMSLPRDQATSPVRLLERAELDLLPVKDVTEALATLPNVSVRRTELDFLVVPVRSGGAMSSLIAN